MIIALPVLAPDLRDAHSLSLLQVGVVLDSLWIGTLLTLLPWGVLADRFGERLVLAAGLTACGGALVGAGYAGGFLSLILLIGLAGAAGASVNAASGRAVMQWFPAAERGFALGVRQTAIPLGGLISALVLPTLSLRSAFVFLACLCVVGALFGVAAIREAAGFAEDDVLEPRGLGATLRDHRLWLLCVGSSFYLVAQLAITGFLVLFLHDERGLSDAEAAGVLAGVQVIAVEGASAVTLAVATALLSAPLAVLIAAFVLAGGWSMAWNGLSFTAAAEIAGRSRSGAALGMQQSALAAAGAIVPPAFAAVVAASSWRVGFALAALFPLAGVQLLRPLRA